MRNLLVSCVVALSACIGLPAQAQQTSFGFKLLSDLSDLVVGSGNLTVNRNPIDGVVNTFDGIAEAGILEGGVTMFTRDFGTRDQDFMRHGSFTATFASGNLVGFNFSGQTFCECGLLPPQHFLTLSQGTLGISGGNFTWSESDTYYEVVNDRLVEVTVGFSDHGQVVFAQSVPEPSTYAMLMAGLTGLGLVSRRRGGVRVSA